jgi:nitrous oxide reductase
MHKKEAGMSQKKAVLSRRNFLLTVGAGGAVTAAAIVGKNAATSAAPAGKDKRATSGYKVSEHIENYYRTTKV